MKACHAKKNETNERRQRNLRCSIFREWAERRKRRISFVRSHWWKTFDKILPSTFFSIWKWFVIQYLKWKHDRSLSLSRLTIGRTIERAKERTRERVASIGYGHKSDDKQTSHSQLAAAHDRWKNVQMAGILERHARMDELKIIEKWSDFSGGVLPRTWNEDWSCIDQKKRIIIKHFSHDERSKNNDIQSRHCQHFLIDQLHFFLH